MVFVTDDKPMDFPIDVMIKQAQHWIDNGKDVFQRFNCEKCGERITAEIANRFDEAGRCPHCEHVTDLRKTGCNFLVRIKLDVGTPHGDENAIRNGNGYDHDADP